MKTKSAAQIQAEIDLMRLAYRQRCDEADHQPTHPLLHAAPYLISVTVAVMIIATLCGIFL